LGEIFVEPAQFILLWNRPIMVFLGFFFLVYYFFDPSEKKRNFKILILTIVIVFVAANLTVYVEQGVNSLFNKNIRMAFQLIRFQKFVLMLMQIGVFLLLADLMRKYMVSDKIKIAISAAFVLLLTVSTMPALSKVPLIGDDLMTSVLPNNLKFFPQYAGQNRKDMAKMLDYIDRNTSKDAVFYGYNQIRAATGRSVVMDGKGAGMLIEGNREKFVQWYVDTETFDKLPDTMKPEFLRAKKVNYVMTDKQWKSLTPIKKIGKFYLYKI